MRRNRSEASLATRLAPGLSSGRKWAREVKNRSLHLPLSHPTGSQGFLRGDRPADNFPRKRLEAIHGLRNGVEYAEAADWFPPTNAYIVPAPGKRRQRFSRRWPSQERVPGCRASKTASFNAPYIKRKKLAEKELRPVRWLRLRVCGTAASGPFSCSSSD